jgi:hypothetical protein
MRFKAQSSSAASVEGSCFIRASVSFSPWHLSTASGLNSSNTPFGSSLNHFCHPHTQKITLPNFQFKKPQETQNPHKNKGKKLKKWKTQKARPNLTSGNGKPDKNKTLLSITDSKPFPILI